jgi:hypothetical protein
MKNHFTKVLNHCYSLIYIFFYLIIVFANSQIYLIHFFEHSLINSINFQKKTFYIQLNKIYYEYTGQIRSFF